MTERMNRRFARAAALLLAVLLLAVTPFGTARAASGEEGTAQAEKNITEITLQYQPTGLAYFRTAQIPYSDDCFTHPATEFDNTLLQSSIGFAMSAFRAKGITLEHQKDRAVSFLTQAGFTDIACYCYDEAPGTDTISNVIAQKKIGDFTLIAVAPCGAAYGTEWASNFTVGTEPRHQGFGEAAAQVEERLAAYVEEHAISGEKRLWVTGFSRAAATGNLVAGDMTASGDYSQVYAYLFATPRNTCDPVAYENIFNILGRNDPVPMVPLPDWGFGRYGIDLYTPSQEQDSDFAARKAEADVVSQKLTGKPMRNLPEVNHDIHALLEYLKTIASTQQEYVERMQQAARDGAANRTAGNLLDSLLQVIDNVEADEKTTELQAFREFIEGLIFKYLKGSEYSTVVSGWDTDAPLVDNLVHEHSPEVYLIWALAAKDRSFYREESSYTRLVVSGDVALEVTAEDGFAGRFLPDGTKETMPSGLNEHVEVDQSKTELYFVRKGTQSVLYLPHDSYYVVSLAPLSDGEISYLAVQISNDYVEPTISDRITIDAKKGTTYYAVFRDFDEDEPLGEQESLTEWSSSVPYSPGFLLELENANVSRVTVMSLISTIFIIGVVIAVLILFLVVYSIICHIRHKPRGMRTIIGYHALWTVGLFWLEEMTRFRFGAVTVLISLMKGLTTFSVLTLALKGSHFNRTRRNGFIDLALLICIVGDMSLNLNFKVGLAFQLASMIVLIIAFFHGHRGGAAPWIAGGLTLSVSAFLLIVFRNTKGLTLAPMWGFAVVMAVLAWTAAGQSKLTLTAAAAYIVSVILLFYNLVFGKTIISHGLSLGVYYAALLLFAGVTWQHPNGEAAFPDTPKGGAAGGTPVSGGTSGREQAAAPAQPAPAGDAPVIVVPENTPTDDLMEEAVEKAEKKEEK